jgi:hypothetical protein
MAGYKNKLHSLCYPTRILPRPAPLSTKKVISQEPVAFPMVVW